MALKKDKIRDPKFDEKAQASVYIGNGLNEGRKCIKGYTFDFRHKNYRGRIVYSNHVHSDPTYFPFRRSGEERVVSLSGANYMSGKEELDQEISLPPEIEEWGKCAEMRYDDQTSEDQQEIEQTPVHSEKGNIEDDNTPVEVKL